MAETYCGKTCEECIQKDALNCPGCKAGPGRQFGGECELAKCCRDKGHDCCETCSFCKNCRTLMGRERQPETRIKRVQDAQKLREVITKRASVLGKWLFILFWLVVPTTVASILGNDYIFSSFSGILIAGNVLYFLCSAFYGLILLKISSEDEEYRIAGICTLIVALLTLVKFFVFGTDHNSAWLLVIALPSLIVGLIGEYHEFNAFSSVLIPVDSELSYKWLTLWKWYVGSIVGLFSGIILMLILPILGAILLFVVVIVNFVAGIVRIVYIYQTAAVFRSYPGKFDIP